MKTILVTGGAGYIGSACVATLLDQGNNVVIIDNLSKGKKELIHPKATFHELDLATDDITEACKGVDAVIHFAAYKAVEESMENAPKYSDNIKGTINVLNAMVHHDIKKIIFSSTAAVYGNPEYVPLDEQHLTRPVNYYGQTKLLAESLLQWYENIHGISFVALRYFNVVGDKLGYLDPDPKNVIPLIIEAALGKREKFMIFGDDYDTPDGTCLRDYIDINDLVRAHILALDLKHSAIINLGSEQGTSVKELVSLVKEVSGKEFVVETVGRRKGDPAVVVASSKKAKEVLAWEANVSLKESVMKMYAAYVRAH